MPNQPQEQSPQPERPQKKTAIDYKDEPPPVIEANQAANENEENEGEGNKSADRNYRRGVQEHLKKKNVKQEGKDAADALDDEAQRQDLEDAEEAARKGQIH